MAFMNLLYRDLATVDRGLVLVAGRVAIGSTGAVGTQTGKGFSVARTGAGLYTVTLTPGAAGVPAFLFAHADVLFATGGNTQTAKLLTLVASTSVVTIQCNDAATVDVAADPPSGSVLLFMAITQNVTIT